MRIGIDIGGTFTDFVLFDPTSGAFETFKTLSTPGDPAEAVLTGLAQARQAGKIDRLDIVHGSTVATNALLEGKGAVTALIATKGFRDVIEIGRQNRPDIYDLFAQRPPPLAPAALRYEVDERVNFEGEILRPLDMDTLEPLVEALKGAGVESVAVSLLFSFLHPAHEAAIAARLRAANFFVSPSSEVLPEFREYERTSTTVINAYVAPVMDRYLARLERESGATDFRVIQSNGGSIRAEQARREAARCVLSGPAGGVVGAQYVAQTAGFKRLLTFDMGGTSTDVSLCDGEIQITTEAAIGGHPIRLPIIDIHTVGSGGGSMAYVDPGGALRVGPQSAGADPGPICYNQGGQTPTVTDANLILGRLAADQFLGGQMALNEAAAEAALTRLAREANLTPQPGLTPAQTAALGIIEIVNAHMERALRVISVQRGHDPRQFALVSFGGAGGLHAAGLARNLNIPHVLIPPNAATLSAFGMLAAEVVKDYVQTVMLPGDSRFQDLEQQMAPLLNQGRADVIAEGVSPDAVTLQPALDMRYQGQSYELLVPMSADFLSDFHAIHSQSYGYNQPERPVEIVNLRLRAVGHLPKPALSRKPADAAAPSPDSFDRRPVVLSAGLATVPFYKGDSLQPGHQIMGPAVVVYPDTTVFAAPDDRLRLDEYGNLVCDVGL
jgi:N-methylhydantoinase A